MRKQNTRKQKTIIASTIAAVAVLTALFCFEGEEANAAAEQPAAMPVHVDVIKNKPVQIWKSFSGRMAAVDYAEIRPQVSGVVTEIRFEDGQHVKKGDVLYVIDPRPYKAAVDKAEADLAAAKNQAAFAEKEYKRAKSLVKSDAISERVRDERENTSDVANATVKGMQAALDQAQINLDFAYVKAPISGRVSRAEITVGNLVEAGSSAPILTTVVSNEGIYADFEVDENTYLSTIRSQTTDFNSEKNIPVRINLAHSLYQGTIHSFDNKIDVASGTIRARALLNNKDGALLPGMFVSIEMGSPTTEKHIVLTERAISTNQDRKFVYVVENGKVAYREVTIGESVEGSRIIKSGLKDGDMVITEGIIRIRPGMMVDPQVNTEKPATDAPATEAPANEATKAE